MNLLQETILELEENGKTPADVVWVGSSDAYTEWETFAAIAQDIECHSRDGVTVIPPELLVVGEDWWIERVEYDGAEGWSFKTKPKRPAIRGIAISWHRRPPVL